MDQISAVPWDIWPSFYLLPIPTTLILVTMLLGSSVPTIIIII